MATIVKTRAASATPLVLLLGTAVFLNYVDRGAMGIAAPLMKTELHLSNAAYGLIFSAFFWIYSPVQLVVGWLCDRFSVYRLMALGVLVWAAGTFLTGFAAGFLSLLLLRILLGTGETIAFPGASKIIARHVPAGGRGAANAALALGIALGPAAGTLAGGIILASFGWRAIFLTFGVLTLLWLAPWQTTTRNIEAARPVREERVPVAALIGKWSLWSMSIAQIASTYVFYFVLAWLPLFLTKSRGLPIAEMTFLATLGYAAQALAALSTGGLSDRLTRSGRSESGVRRVMMIGGQLLAAVSILALAFADGPLQLGILLVLAGVASGILSLNTYAVAQMFAGPRASGTWVGIQNAVGNLSGIVGPLVTGIIVDRAGFTIAFYVAAAVSAFGAVWWIVAMPKIAQVKLD